MVTAWHINFDSCMDILQLLRPLVSPRTSSSEVRPCEPCGASCWSLPLLHLYACIYCYRRMHDQLRYCVTPGWCVCDILWDVLWSPWLRADRPCVCDALLRFLSHSSTFVFTSHPPITTGGTFLFVATAHILPDVLSKSGKLSWLEVSPHDQKHRSSIHV